MKTGNSSANFANDKPFLLSSGSEFCSTQRDEAEAEAIRFFANAWLKLMATAEGRRLFAKVLTILMQKSQNGDSEGLNRSAFFLAEGYGGPINVIVDETTEPFVSVERAPPGGAICYITVILPQSGDEGGSHAVD